MLLSLLPEPELLRAGAGAGARVEAIAGTGFAIIIIALVEPEPAKYWAAPDPWFIHILKKCKSLMVSKRKFLI